jgi:nitrogenase molybdenum-cofactor synthesis protein NifE
MLNTINSPCQIQINEKYLYEQKALQALPDAHDSSPSGRVSGAILAVSSLQGAIPVLHGSSGCGFHYRYLCRRQKAPAYDLQCSNLTELELILGSENKLKQTILNTYRKFHPPLIAIIPTVPSEIINVDIEGVIKELQSMMDCILIQIATSGISHGDKRKIGRSNICKGHHSDTGNVNGHDVKMSGCGFSDAMTSLVRQVMKPQQVIPRSVNLCGIAWGIMSDVYSDGIARELIGLGCTINAKLPACTLAELETAPQAELNLLTYRVRWAAEMKSRFHTQYFAADYRIYSSRGINGILDFYSEIADLLNLPKDAMECLFRQAEGAKAVLSEASMYFAGKKAILCCGDYRNLESLLDFYLDTMHFDISNILVEVTDNGYFCMMDEAQRLSEAEQEIRYCLDERKLHITYHVNPTRDCVDLIMSDAVFLLGSDCYQNEGDQSFYVEKPSALPLNLLDFQNMIIDYIQWVKKQQAQEDSQSKLLTYKLFHNRNLTTEKCHEASRKMWDNMWLKRSCRQIS